ncbi:hypothetical protein BU26DRAFT_437362 [Trematosphaeria pertusa]|uniref:Uncharacterized protein n=1 Tax=Trematosphaeria pertusa TaxID=390896 RepID=A0A6A6HZ44_9PLEO|nr:uncharacterized protein BU26DRAFT_437362 [Trematosphaeria pertusa]KAF2243307.1 hypothetical protein BU26DRAFT_437362 [Trematosphaeria pertusa]
MAVFSTQYAWKREGLIKNSTPSRRILAISCVVLSGTALIVSLASIVTIKSRLKEVTSAHSRGTVTDWNDYLNGQIGVWILACLTQCALYSSLLWSKPKPQIQPISLSGPRDSVMSEVRHSDQTANLYILEPTQPSSPLAALPSPTFSTRSSQSLKSWRESLHHAVRPVTSRTKLIKQPSFTRDARSIYSDGHSIANVSQSDGFDSWEVGRRSHISLSNKDAAIQLASAPSRGTALEPIPGSRPASPARALDGPFPASDDGHDELPPPPKLMPDISRPPSPAISEAHIHPLFRSESPTPPPAATPGTSIVASPLANQMIACPPRPYSRMRSNSRAGSPSPLVHSQSFQERAMTPQRNSRSPSPPSREMTPPIPDFVLNPSPRSSMSGTHSRRKVSLPVETGR